MNSVAVSSAGCLENNSTNNNLTAKGHFPTIITSRHCRICWNWLGDNDHDTVKIDVTH